MKSELPNIVINFFLWPQSAVECMLHVTDSNQESASILPLGRLVISLKSIRWTENRSQTWQTRTADSEIYLPVLVRV